MARIVSTWKGLKHEGWCRPAGERHPFLLRIPIPLMHRAHELARARGQSIQRFLLDAITAAVEGRRIAPPPPPKKVARLKPRLHEGSELCPHRVPRDAYCETCGY